MAVFTAMTHLLPRPVGAVWFYRLLLARDAARREKVLISNVKLPGPRDFHVTSYLRRCCAVTGTPRKKRMWKAPRNPPRRPLSPPEKVD